MGPLATSRSLLLCALLAFCGHAAAQDYGNLRVLDTKVLEGPAGPGVTGALLSPDGSRVLRIHSGICLLAPAQIGSWAEMGCAEDARGIRPGGPEDMFWSPAGDRLLMPTVEDALTRFRDTDIEIFDPYSWSVTTLTDDGYEGSITKAPGGTLDFAAHWVDADTIAFLRYPLGDGMFSKEATPSLMLIDADGSNERTLLQFAPARLTAYAVAASADGRHLAYAAGDRDGGDASGIYVLDLNGGEPRRVAPMKSFVNPPAGLAFSADGSSLLVFSRGTAEDLLGGDANVLDLASGAVTPVAPNQKITAAAWAPTGSALAYVTFDPTKPNAPGGLFISPAPGRPGRLLIGGAFMTPFCCGRQPFTWASNNTMILGSIDPPIQSLFVQLGE
jgi:hypothetical protein